MSLPTSAVLAILLAAASLGAQSPPPPAPAAEAAPPKGEGDLMVLPTRVVLEGRERSAEVFLKNYGSEKATYRVFFREMRMTPEGTLENRDKAPEEQTAADVIRYSPRQVELAPGETQVVRIQVRIPEGLPAGEYRSHLNFQAVPKAAPPSLAPMENDKAVHFKLIPIYGISIPVIVRHGEVVAEGGISAIRCFQDAKLAAGATILEFKFDRKGNRSLLADVTVTVDSGGPLKPGTLLQEAKGVAVYNGLDFRLIRMPLLGAPKGTQLNATRLKIVLTYRDLKKPPVVAFHTVDI